MLDLASRLLIRLDRSQILDAIGIRGDAWQRRVLTSDSPRLLLNTHRQSCKSTCTSALALATALYEDESLTLIVSASQRQSREMLKKVQRGYRLLGSPLATLEDNADTLALENGSRVVSLPDSPETIVGYSSPQLILIDESARVSDETYLSMMPMMAVSNGRVVAMSTPLGRRGWWSDAWHDGGDAWERITFTAWENPRIDRAWLEEQRIILGERLFRQDFMCSFEARRGQIFDNQSIDRAFANGKPALFGGAA